MVQTTQRLIKSISFLAKQPQLVYTIFLLVVITLAFLLNSQKFLDVAILNQERLEKSRIGLMQDVFAEFSLDLFERPEALQRKIQDIVELNTSIAGFHITEKREGEYHVIASLNPEEVGAVIGEDSRALYDGAAINPSTSVIFPGTFLTERHWRAMRAITDDGGTIRGVIYTDLSMAQVDALLSDNIRTAYYWLIIIIASIGVLIIRQAKVVDYGVLYKRLKEVDQMKDDFISMAAHELRTPLTIIRGYADMLNDSKRLSETDREMTSKIGISANNLGQLIGDILDVARLQQGRLSFDMKDIQPRRIIDDVVASLTYTANQKGLALAYKSNESAFISVDVDRLKQALINIIGNAVKYTLKGSVTVTTYVEQELYMIRVSDTGIGISAENQKKLFSRFYRVKSRETENIRGTGLGLWITKEIISQMKGVISVESIQGKGTDFIISFPIVKQEK
jgi:signal transduction histidine kinase